MPKWLLCMNRHQYYATVQKYGCPVRRGTGMLNVDPVQQQCWCDHFSTPPPPWGFLPLGLRWLENVVIHKHLLRSQIGKVCVWGCEEMTNIAGETDEGSYRTSTVNNSPTFSLDLHIHPVHSSTFSPSLPQDYTTHGRAQQCESVNSLGVIQPPTLNHPV